MTTKVRRHVKPGSATFDSTGEVVSIIAAAFSKTPCEFETKTTGFSFWLDFSLSEWHALKMSIFF